MDRDHSLSTEKLDVPIRYLFWNIRASEKAQDLIPFAAAEQAIDVIIVSEIQSDNVPKLVERLNVKGMGLYSRIEIKCPNIAIVSRLPTRFFEPVYDDDRMTIVNVSTNTESPYLLIAVHLSSKMWSHDAAQAMLTIRVVDRIRNAEHRFGHKRTIVVGDFNMNPFEIGMVGSEYFHSVMAKSVAKRLSREVERESRDFFYNPMWRFLGDGPGRSVSGSYYYGSGAISYFWNTFDQVLLRPQIMDSLNPESLSILDRIGSKSLLTDHGIPDKDNVSDHLPIVFTLDNRRKNGAKEFVGEIAGGARRASSN